ncbi:MAG TPA: hypothetical protein VG843_10680 [Rhizomicrobium sp.]|nr:hypothetical protein [Rhizomicrobium sp.]
MRKPRLSVEIAALLALKLLALTGLYFAFFSPSHQSRTDAPAVEHRLLSSDS